MNIELLTSKPGTITMDEDSRLYKNIEHILYKVMKADEGRLQEVFDVFYGKEGIKSAFIEFSRAEKTVKIENEEDYEQVYLKGLVDGMHVMHLFTMVNYSVYMEGKENE